MEYLYFVPKAHFTAYTQFFSKEFEEVLVLEYFLWEYFYVYASFKFVYCRHLCSYNGGEHNWSLAVIQLSVSRGQHTAQCRASLIQTSKKFSAILNLSGVTCATLRPFLLRVILINYVFEYLQIVRTLFVLYGPPCHRCVGLFLCQWRPENLLLKCCVWSCGVC